MTEIIRITDKEALPATSPFCHLVMDDLYAYVAGRVAADLPGHEDILGDTYQEALLIMRTIKALVEKHGLSLGNTVQSTVHLVDLNEISEMDKAYGSFFENGQFPARTCIESPKLYGGSRVEITCTIRR